MRNLLKLIHQSKVLQYFLKLGYSYIYRFDGETSRQKV